MKGIVVLTRNNCGDAAEDPYLVASASSDGVIRVWDVRMALKEKPIPLAEAKTNSRLTCLAGSSIKSELYAYLMHDFSPIDAICYLLLYVIVSSDYVFDGMLVCVGNCLKLCG